VGRLYATFVFVVFVGNCAQTCSYQMRPFQFSCQRSPGTDSRPACHPPDSCVVSASVRGGRGQLNIPQKLLFLIDVGVHCLRRLLVRSSTLPLLQCVALSSMTYATD
jgi:hypothetical protein